MQPGKHIKIIIKSAVISNKIRTRCLIFPSCFLSARRRGAAALMANSTAGPLHIPDDVLKTTLDIIKTFCNLVSSQFLFGTVVETSEDEMFH